MPSESQTRAVIHPTLIERINKTLPKYKLDQGISTCVQDLVNEALDSRTTLSGPPGHYSYSSNSSSFEELERESVREKGRETFIPHSEYFTCYDETKHKEFLEQTDKSLKKDSPAFLQFWQVFNKAPQKAGQSKAKARTAWKEALKKEKPERLIEAARKAVQNQVDKIGRDEFVPMLPDAYRWLRDERYAEVLEEHVADAPVEIIPGVTAL